MAQYLGDPVTSPRRDQQSLGTVMCRPQPGCHLSRLELELGRGAPFLLTLWGWEPRRGGQGVSTAPMRLVTENFPLFSPRMSESPCTGTKRSPDDPLGVLQEAFGEAELGGR